MTEIRREDLLAFQSGDEQAFARIYEAMAESSMRYAAVIVGHDQLAADAVQETFLRLYRHRCRYDVSQPFRPWFFRILQNECKRVLRWRKRLLPVDEIPERAAKKADNALYESIAQLPLSIREPLVLRYVMGYKDQEVAEQLGISLAAAKARVKRAREKLREKLSENGGDLIWMKNN
jgi:RNA polymerase sigma-70 factor (ECF subfamily)